MSIFSKLFGSKKIEDQEIEEEVACSTEDTSLKEESLPDPQNLPEAMRYVVQKWGTTYLQNRSLLNILNDFQVLKEIPAAKHIIRNLQESGYMERLSAISNWELDSKSIVSQYVNEFGAKEDITLYIIQCVGYGLHFCDDIPCMKEPEVINEPTFDEPEEQTININPVQNIQPPLGPYDPKLDLAFYQYPSLDLLKIYEDDGKPNTDLDEQDANKNRIIEVLSNYGIGISSIRATIGPTVTFYEITPAQGERMARIRHLEEDIALSLSPQGARVIAPIPGRGTVGIEVPNKKKNIVSMRSVLDSKKFQETTMDLPCAMGKTATNEVFMFDLAKAPHVLMSGATGQGKSVGLNAILTSLLFKKHPAEMKLVLIDTKLIEFSIYAKIANHFLAQTPDTYTSPIITDSSKAISTLQSLCVEMDSRYELLMKAGERNIKDYNSKFMARLLNPSIGHKFMPYIVVVIDDYGDLMTTAGKEIEQSIVRLAQKAHIVGIHMIIATQHPRINIITSAIKNNFPTRIAFKVNQSYDSKTILDCMGAQQLLGCGDMLYLSGSSLTRVQCAFVDTPEVDDVTRFIAKQQSYIGPFELPDPKWSYQQIDADLSHLDPMFEDAARLIVSSQQGSTSLIQRKFSIGYSRAGHLMDQLEKAGIVGAAHGAKPRLVLIQDEMSLDNILRALR